VVKTAELSKYFSAPTSAQLLYEVGGLLSELGVGKQNKQLEIISDGAGWILSWDNRNK
jgi:hypothetical protein